MEDEELNWFDQLADNPTAKPGTNWFDDLADYNDQVGGYSELFGPASSMTGHYGVGDSKYDYNVPFDALPELNEIRAQRQPWSSKFASGLGRVPTKAAFELLKMPGILGGTAAGIVGEIGDAISGENNTDFFKTAFNNSWVQSMNQGNEWVNENALPVYVKQAVRDGNLWDNIKAIDFWATDGADGLGFILSMLVPGQVATKMGVGAKLAKGANKAGLLSDKALRASQYVTRSGKIGSKYDLAMATTANTVFESAVEAQHAMDNYMKPYEEQYQQGLISLEEYNKHRNNSSNIARNVFLSNAAILVGPNAVMSKIIWGGNPVKSNKGMLTSLTKQGAKKGQTLRDVAQAYGEAGLREGFWEEGMQSTVEEYFTANPEENILGLISDLPKAYGEMISKTDGQKAIFLGLAFGGGMTAIGEVVNKTSQKERDLHNARVDQQLANIANLRSVFGSEVKTDREVLERMKGLQGFEELSQRYETAIEEGDADTVEEIRNKMTTLLVAPVVEGNLDLDVFEEELRGTAENNEGIEPEIVDQIMGKARMLKKSYETFQKYADKNIPLDIEDATDVERAAFYNILSNNYIELEAQKLELQQKIESLRKDKEKLDLPSELIVDDEDAAYEQANKAHHLTKAIDESIGETKKKLAKVQDDLNNFWDSEARNKEFSEWRNGILELQEKLAKAQELDAVFKEIDKAKTFDEVNQIKAEGDFEKAIQDAKDRRIAQLEQEEKAKTAVAAQKQQEEQVAKDDDLYTGRELAADFDIGEDIVTTNDDGSERTLTITAKDPTGVTLIDYTTGEEFTFPTEGTELVPKVEKPQADGVSTEGVPENESIRDEGESEDNIGVVKMTEMRNPRVVNYEAIADEDFLTYQNEPVDKTGRKVEFEFFVQPWENLSEDDPRYKAIQIAQKDPADITDEEKELLYDYLPINAVFAEGVKAPLETKSLKSDRFNAIYNSNTRPMRKAIIDAWINGAALNEISTVISGQGNGQIQLEEEVLENSLLGLYEVAAKITEDNPQPIVKEDIFIVNQFGKLQNLNGDRIKTNRDLAPGEIYLRIHLANGKVFPLKLNVKRVSETEADVLYYIYQWRAEQTDDKMGRDTALSETGDLWQVVQDNLPNEIAWFEENGFDKDDITVGQLIDLLIYTSEVSGKSSPKTDVKFVNGNLYLGRAADGGMMLTPEQLADESNREAFKQWFVANKRRHIRFKKSNKEAANSPGLENTRYLDYLVEQGILNTNAKTGEPTFQGQEAAIYLSPIIRIGDQIPTPPTLEVTTVEEMQSIEELAELEPEMPEGMDDLVDTPPELIKATPNPDAAGIKKLIAEDPKRVVMSIIKIYGMVFPKEIAEIRSRKLTPEQEAYALMDMLLNEKEQPYDQIVVNCNLF